MKNDIVIIPPYIIKMLKEIHLTDEQKTTLLIIIALSLTEATINLIKSYTEEGKNE